jgi:hypothetical protein
MLTADIKWACAVGQAFTSRAHTAICCLCSSWLTYIHTVSTDTQEGVGVVVATHYMLTAHSDCACADQQASATHTAHAVCVRLGLNKLPGGGGGGGGGRQSDEPPEVGTIHKGGVKRIEAYGVFVALPGFRKYGLVHASQVGVYVTRCERCALLRRNVLQWATRWRRHVPVCSIISPPLCATGFPQSILWCQALPNAAPLSACPPPVTVIFYCC